MIEVNQFTIPTVSNLFLFVFFSQIHVRLLSRDSISPSDNAMRP